MTANRRSTRLRLSLLQSGCASALALMGGLHAAGAMAQTYDGVGFAGQANVQSGTVTFSNSGATGDTIQVDSSTAIINWRPTDTNGTGNIDFLPSGHTAQFTNNPSAQQDFTVLNRILPVDTLGAPVLDRTVALNGGITSTQFSASGAVTGGSVYFYTPGGFILGPTGAINAGSVILTTNDITAGLGTNSLSFRGIANSTSAITITGQAQINAATQGGYVALVAPRIVQNGTVSSNGSIAYVAAEQADITINNGLFDIAILAGTTDGNGIVHTGTSGGPASTPTPTVPDPQRVYMVGIAKNDALTMLLSGSVGYAAAASVAEEQSAVVLSAGYNVTNGDADVFSATGGTGTSNIALGATSFTSAMTALAAGSISADPGLFGTLAFQAAASLTAASSISMRVDDSGTISAAQSLNLTTGIGTAGGSITLVATGSDAVSAIPGQIRVTDALSINANASAEAGLSPLDGADATGGTISVIADLGSITAGSFSANATSFSEIGTNSSGDARGGSVALAATRSGTLALGNVTIDTSAAVQFDAVSSPVNGGNAFGGSVDISAGSGGILAFGDVVASAQATAGTATTGQAGSATGGDVRIAITDGDQQWTSFRGDVTTAAGFASNGGGFGGATPGADGVLIDVSGTGSLTLSQSMSLYGDAYAYGGGAAGTGTVRASDITVRARDGGRIQIANDLFASAMGEGRGSFSATIFDRTAAMAGGNITLAASGGTFSAQGLTLDVSAYAKDGNLVAGDVTAGSISILADTPAATRGVMDLGSCSFGCSISADARGETGLTGSNATGGTIQISASDADLTMNGFAYISATGQAGVSTADAGGTGGNGTGGSVTIASLQGTQGTAALTFGTVQSYLDGSGDPGVEGPLFNSGNGGIGQGGTFTLTMDAGTLSATDLSLRARGTGGAVGVSAGAPYVAGDGIGGAVNVDLRGGTMTLVTLAIDASGIGGGVASSFSGGTLGTAGNGTGGSASFTASGGTLNADTIQIVADGTGGLAEDGFESDAGNGGNGTGGTATFTMAAGGAATVGANAITVSAAGIGGNGGGVFISSSPDSFIAGNGGNGAGGQARLDLSGGALTAGQITVTAGSAGGAGGDNGSAGNGGNAGSGSGGGATIAYLSEGHSIGTMVVSATGSGGRAGLAGTIIGYDAQDNPIYGFGPGNGGNGGNGTGGSAALTVDVDPSFANLTITASGTGSAGANGAIGGTGGTGSGGTGGGGAILTHSFGLLDVSGTLLVQSEGTGGAGGNGSAGVGGRGGDGIGGDATLSIDGTSATLQSTVLSVSSNGSGGLGGFGTGVTLPGTRGGDGTGGTALFSASNGATVLFRDATSVTAQGLAAPGTYGTGGTAGQGGNATGGSATMQLTDALASMVTSNPQALILLSASALGGDSIGTAPSGSPGATAANGGDALGGSARFSATGSQAQFLSVRVDAHATGGQGASALADGGNGGSATGGSASFLGTGSTLQLAGPLDLDGSGVGGNGGFSPAANGGRGGTGNGGAAAITLSGGSLAVDSITACACGTGGAGGLASIGSGGAGGAAMGGAAAITGDGGGALLQLALVDLGANATGGQGGDGSAALLAAGAGGGALAGTTLFGLSNGAAATLDSLGVSAQAVGGNGGRGGDGTSTVAGGQGGDGGAGGSATGGDARFSIDGATALVTTFFASGDGYGGLGGQGGTGSSTGVAGTGGSGGAGGAATGGGAALAVTNGSLQLGAGVSDTFGIHAIGTGGQGGAGGTGGSFSTLIGATGIGGNGGNGTGGTAMLTAITASLLLPETRIEAMGYGGTGGIGSTGGLGGIALGGTASADFSTATTAIFTGPLAVSADATGGMSGDALSGPGLSGGDGQAGTAAFSASGAGTVITLVDTLVSATGAGGNGGAGGAGGSGTGGDAGFSILNGAALSMTGGGIAADGAGGVGGLGPSGANGGDGGAGGNGTGGTVTYRIGNARATIGTTSADLYSLSARGIGALGGQGGDSLSSGTGGNGGGGGNGQGGFVDFAANTGDFAFQTTSISTIGTGGLPGLGGNGSTTGAPGTAGLDLGGNISIANSDNGTMASGAVRQFDSLSVTAANTGGNGSLQLTDSSTATGGGLVVTNQLSLINTGGLASSNPTPAITVGSIANAIRVGSLSSISGRATQMSFAGSGSLTATGAMNITSSDSITISHGGQPATPVDTLAASNLSIFAAGPITAGPGTRLRAGNLLDMLSGTSTISAADIAAVNGLTAQSAGDMTIGNAATTGVTSYLPGNPFTSGALLTLQAGAGASFPSGPALLNITGTVASTGGVLAQALGSIDIASGATVRADNRIQIEAGNNIVVHSGAQIAAAQNPAGPTGFANAVDDPAALYLSAGNAIRDLTTPGYASILIDGTLAAPNRPVILEGEAIQANASSIQSGSLYVAILRAPAPGAVDPGDDIALSPECGQGNICLGAITASDVVRIGPVTGTTDMPNRVSIAGTLAARDIVIRARDTLTFTTAAATAASASAIDRLFLASLTGPVTLGNGAVLSSTGSLTLFSAGSLLGNGSLIGSGSVGLSVNGDLSLGTLSAGTTVDSVDANGIVTQAGLLGISGALSLGRLSVGQGQTISAASIAIGQVDALASLTLISGGPVGLTQGTIGGNLDITALGATFGTLAVGGAVDILANGTVSGDRLSAGGAVTLAGAQGIMLTNLASGGATTLTAGNGAIAVTGNIASASAVTASGRSLALNAAGPLIVAQLNATAGNAAVTTAGALVVGSGTATGDLALSGATSLQAANLSATNIDITSSGGATALTGPVTAGNALRIAARGTASFAGQVAGQTIIVGSGDITIATGASLSSAGVLTLNATDSQRATYIGGADTTLGYSLSGNEIARLFAGSIAVAAPRVAALSGASLGSTRAPDVVIGSFTLNAGSGGAIGQNGTLTIATPGKLRVNGDVRITGLGAQGGLTLAADEALEVIAGSGTIDLRDGNGGLAGLLSLRSADIIAATAAAIADVAAATSLTARSNRLGINDGIMIDEGMLRADAISLAATGGVYIQNVGATNAFADRRGFTANSIAIATQNAATGGGRAQIVINGRLSGAAGFVTGLDVIPLVSINGASGRVASGFDLLSTVNGCLIVSTGGCTLQPVTVDNKDTLDSEFDTDPRQIFQPVFPTTFVELRSLPQYGYPPLIDEPVTGAGNDDLWETPMP
ncbi:hypothetical protein [Sphingobium aquiterrae]|uniref:beta strand repeat-containing protein n=1 Tax=Sphingobium aquiterrae TaxID=2038656 RepID=UPI00301AE184